MFRIVNRLIHWTGKYRKRIYIDCLCFFFSQYFYRNQLCWRVVLSAVLDDFHGVVNLQAREIWVLLWRYGVGGVCRYIFSYLRAKTQGKRRI